MNTAIKLTNQEPAMPTILLIDKGNNTHDLLRQVISEIDYVLMAEGPEVALYKLGDSTPDLIILDLGLRAPDSALICRRLRAIPRFYGAPILALTTLASPGDIARVLDAGADDCLRKPLVLRELGARIRALMRRPNRAETYTWITLVRAEKAVLVRDEPVELTPTEFDLLEALCRTPGEPVHAHTLLQEVWNYPPGVGDPALVRNHVRNLRRKLERDPDRPRIVTSSHGRGYAVSVDIRRR